MSDTNAIAAVSEALRNLLAKASGLGAESIITEPLDRLAELPASKRLNLCLFQILPNAHWRNQNIPWRTNDGETAPAPLALDLRYLLTATARAPNDPQKDLGLGMRILHDNPVLNPGGAAVPPFERARVTMHPLTLDEMEKLWMGVPTPRLLSVAYEVSVVLIESTNPVRLPLPVLTRGTGVPDSIEVQAGVQQLPAIERIEVGNTKFDNWLKSRSRAARTVAQIGDDLRIYGPGLGDAEAIRVSSLMHSSVAPLDFAPSSAPDGAIKIVLDEQKIRAGGLPAGLISVFVVLKKTPQRVTNSVPLAFAPKIAIAPASLAAPGRVTVTVDPPLIAGQRITLILGDREIRPQSGGTPTFLPFDLTSADVGRHRVRLRVDGVDSIVINLDGPDAQGRPTFTDVLEVK